MIKTCQTRPCVYVHHNGELIFRMTSCYLSPNRHFLTLLSHDNFSRFRRSSEPLSDGCWQRRIIIECPNSFATRSIQTTKGINIWSHRLSSAWEMLRSTARCWRTSIATRTIRALITGLSCKHWAGRVCRYWKNAPARHRWQRPSWFKQIQSEL